MYVQVATYRLSNGAGEMTDADFIDANREFADMMAAVPGLLAKIWLKNADDKVYGGVYLWRDRQAYENFVASDLWASVVADPAISELSSADYDVMEDLTKTTQPALEVA